MIYLYYIYISIYTFIIYNVCTYVLQLDIKTVVWQPKSKGMFSFSWPLLSLQARGYPLFGQHAYKSSDP